MPIGFRVFASVPRPDPALIKRFAALNTADISDVMRMAGTMDPAIHPVYLPIKKVVGPAVTVSIPSGAFNIIKAGMQQTRAGDVLVINAYGIMNLGLIGGNMCR